MEQRPKIPKDLGIKIGTKDEALWTAVLKKAVKDLNSRSNSIRENVLRWFLNEEIDINTFQGVCFTLNLNAELFREKFFLKKLGINENEEREKLY